MSMNFLSYLFRKRKADSEEEKSNHNDIVDGALWELMLSTNNCYPGCACDEDYFDMTVERVSEWVQQVNIHQVQDALTQCRHLRGALVDSPKLTLNALSQQTNIYFRNINEAREWLERWQDLLHRANASIKREITEIVNCDIKYRRNCPQWDNL